MIPVSLVLTVAKVRDLSCGAATTPCPTRCTRPCKRAEARLKPIVNVMDMEYRDFSESLYLQQEVFPLFSGNGLEQRVGPPPTPY